MAQESRPARPLDSKDVRLRSTGDHPEMIEQSSISRPKIGDIEVMLKSALLVLHFKDWIKSKLSYERDVQPLVEDSSDAVKLHPRVGLVKTYLRRVSRLT